ncbi:MULTISPECIES: major capsid protein [unclassified Ensifer]|uniref:major capsid protein n=1 Tax=unclassified Ensifer TaxID=2633371 RepID=UPI0008131600|nr:MULTISPECIES: major capsid protein [unclassified Ensifer]OCP07979.1 hypothetical protein BC362_10235 [Ensifer sp. LC14]OCP10911.1 hypothetical protein BC374_17730 [Ensifer sp. LC13]OCP11543.1 hypothetical protein BBX50_18125 [Ensifer sp. LC11]OCP33362.1 hypothetical protein BC364_17015 [Ensifer sp. LC499]
MSNIYDPIVLAKTVKRLIRPKTHFLSSAFPIIDVQETEMVAIDIEKSRRALAPFVHPDMPGQAVDALPFETVTLKPAYVKPTSILKPKDTQKRRAGERIGGDMTLRDRRAAAVAETLLDHVDQITRRKEFMAAQLLTTGKATITGENYPTRIIDYRRDPDLTLTLTGTDRWGQADAKPLDDLEDMAERVHEKEGVTVRKITMDPQAWRAFKKDKDVREILDNRRAAGGYAEFGALDLANGAQLAGVFGLFEVWVYSEYYELNGVNYPLMAPGTVVGHSDQMEGIQVHGAILDEEALQAMEIFPNSWIERNPSRRLLQSQSSPILNPGRRNASFTIKAFG